MKFFRLRYNSFYAILAYVIYAGIGSRQTPDDILELMFQLGASLAQAGHILRSGHAPGADQAFERGCRSVQGPHEIYLPWKSFEGGLSDARLNAPTQLAVDIAAEYHPRWQYLKYGAKALHSRNVHQVLGAEVDTPCDFVVCWTKDGKASGGTGQAIRIAEKFGIPVHNLYNEDAYQLLRMTLDFIDNTSNAKSTSTYRIAD